jgi:hypothetical protein
MEEGVDVTTTTRRAAGLGTLVLGVALLAALTGSMERALAQTDGTPVMGPGVLDEAELLAWFEATHPRQICTTLDSRGHCTSVVPYEFRAGDGEVTREEFVRLYLDEGRREGVAADVAFVQAVLETAWFYFPDYGMVRPHHRNFAGIGADDGSGGRNVLTFSTTREGVRAHLQHLRAYADPSTNLEGTNLGSPLVTDVDGRYPARWRYVRGSDFYKTTVWEGFGDGRWATDPAYASKILTPYVAALEFNGHPPDAAQGARALEWHYRYTNTGGRADELGGFGRAGDVVLACDWNGDGLDSPGVFRDGIWTITNHREGSGPVTTFRFGRAGDLPFCGDWTADGNATVGVVRDRTWHLRDSLSEGPPDRSFIYGQVTRGDVPIVGDWNGDGRDTVGIIRDGEWHLRNSQTGGPGEIVFVYGRITLGDRPLIGDWNGDGRTGIGIVRGREWHLRNSLSGGAAEHEFIYGRVTDGDVPLMGDWNGDGRSSPAIVRAP